MVSTTGHARGHADPIGRIRTDEWSHSARQELEKKIVQSTMWIPQPQTKHLPLPEASSVEGGHVEHVLDCPVCKGHKAQKPLLPNTISQLLDGLRQERV